MGNCYSIKIADFVCFVNTSLIFGTPLVFLDFYWVYGIICRLGMTGFDKDES